MWTGLWTGGLGAGDWAVPNYPGHEVRIANLRGVRVCVCVCASETVRGKVAVRFSRPRSLFCGARERPLRTALKAAPLQIRPTFFLQFFPRTEPLLPSNVLFHAPSRQYHKSQPIDPPRTSARNSGILFVSRPLISTSFNRTSATGGSTPPRLLAKKKSPPKRVYSSRPPPPTSHHPPSTSTFHL
jgi:hypothetical protein